VGRHGSFRNGHAWTIAETGMPRRVTYAGFGAADAIPLIPDVHERPSLVGLRRERRSVVLHAHWPAAARKVRSRAAFACKLTKKRRRQLSSGIASAALRISASRSADVAPNQSVLSINIAERCKIAIVPTAGRCTRKNRQVLHPLGFAHR
jgi:hypothetical protein